MLLGRGVRAAIRLHGFQIKTLCCYGSWVPNIVQHRGDPQLVEVLMLKTASVRNPGDTLLGTSPDPTHTLPDPAQTLPRLCPDPTRLYADPTQAISPDTPTDP